MLILYIHTYFGFFPENLKHSMMAEFSVITFYFILSLCEVLLNSKKYETIKTGRHVRLILVDSA